MISHDGRSNSSQERPVSDILQSLLYSTCRYATRGAARLWLLVVTAGIHNYLPFVSLVVSRVLASAFMGTLCECMTLVTVVVCAAKLVVCKHIPDSYHSPN